MPTGSSDRKVLATGAGPLSQITGEMRMQQTECEELRVSSRHLSVEIRKNEVMVAVVGENMRGRMAPI